MAGLQVSDRGPLYALPGLAQVEGGQEPVGDHRAAEGLIDDRFQGPVETDH